MIVYLILFNLIFIINNFIFIIFKIKDNYFYKIMEFIN
jgi:hypothetical protein